MRSQVHDQQEGIGRTRIERLRIKGNFVERLGFPAFFTRVSFIEIVNAFQYDQNNFFSLARITLKPGFIDTWREVLEQDLRVGFVQELSSKENTIECIIQSTSATGFFPLPVTHQGSWAVLPPIAINPQSITLTVIAEESTLPGIHETIESLGSEVSVLAIDDLVKSAQRNRVLAPPFTDRQREVATYAARHGFFEHPKQVSAAAIAGHFNISVSAVNEHIRKARQAAMSFFFG